ncbi:unnamed protein product [Zymoseptoria tritici ST99CH_1A5]|uniref:Peptidase M20 dimerisation domain-containing protein n=1 Tax=Zymoseptoria tritici ST99CH_1A5 TaxID=1276529 RepID=A0A1Y6LZC2_ZYMTR|nr:unnamed protein product [Zymoseptoria tritici ST99CH_1A5]
MSSFSQTLQSHRPDLQPYEELYKHFHANPELSNQEKETAATIASYLTTNISSEFDVRQNIGGFGIAALFRNGEGPTVLLRADFDALPILERTGLPYASKKTQHDPVTDTMKPVMHACGHDMHITCLLAAAHTLVNAKDSWSGTLLLAFQPAEERGTGAQAMVDDGLYDPARHAVPIPDVCIGGHVVPWRAGVLGTRPGLVATSADSMRITLHGRGGHASMPHRLVDPVVLAAHTILRLQTIVSREVDPWDTAVVTVASVQAGDAENVVVDDARIAVDVRTALPATREKVLASVRRIVNAESVAAGAVKPPTIEITRNFPRTVNDEAITGKLEESFSAHFASGPQAYNNACDKLCGSEDFGILASAVEKPASFFMYGGIPHELWDQCEKEGTLSENVPINHSALFAPAIHPTLTTGIDAYVLSALTWVGKR